MAPEIRHSRRHCSVCQQSTWYSATSRWRQDFDKNSLCYTAKRLTDEFPEKSWTIARRPCSGRPRSARTEENVETVSDLILSQEDKSQTHRTVHEISRETGIHRCTRNAICLHFLPYLLNMHRKLEFLISQGSVATCLRWDGYCRMSFVANFMRVPAVQKLWKSVKIWQSYI